MQAVDGTRDIRGWFDDTYRARGHGYLRPPRAYRVLLELLEPGPGKRLLDVGCGPGHLLGEADRYGLHLAGVDFSRVAIELGRRFVPEADLHVADATSLPFADASFDYVTCIGTLERVPDLSRALNEQRRVARHDAKFCFLVRNAGTFFWSVFMDGLGLKEAAAHQEAASLETWTRRFTDAGFEIERVLPDQWPLMWRERVFRRLGMQSRFDRVRRGLRPLRFANEFIFLLRHD